MAKKFERAGFRMVEVPVSHYPRMHGRSEFFRVRHLAYTFKGLLKVWWNLVISHRLPCMDEYRGEKVLITGGLGFIGSNLAIRLVESGASVTILDSLHPTCGANYFNIEPIKKDVEVIEGDSCNLELDGQARSRKALHLQSCRTRQPHRIDAGAV